MGCRAARTRQTTLWPPRLANSLARIGRGTAVGRRSRSIVPPHAGLSGACDEWYCSPRCDDAAMCEHATVFCTEVSLNGGSASRLGKAAEAHRFNEELKKHYTMMCSAR